MKKHIESSGSGNNNGSKKYTQNLVTHYRADNDGMYGMYQVQRFGNEIFPGASNANLVFLDKKLTETYDDDIYFDIGGDIVNPKGVVFDEHTADGRLQGTCTAMLVAQRLRTSNGKKAKLLEETFLCDTQPDVTATQLPNLIKAMHRVKGGEDQEGTYLWACAAYDAILFGQKDESFDLVKAWENFVKAEGFNPEHSSVKRIGRYVKASKARGDDCVTELSYIASRMSINTCRRWLGETFSLMYRDASNYTHALVELKKTRMPFLIQFDSGVEQGHCIPGNPGQGSLGASAARG